MLRVISQCIRYHERKDFKIKEVLREVWYGASANLLTEPWLSHVEYG